MTDDELRLKAKEDIKHMKVLYMGNKAFGVDSSYTKFSIPKKPRKQKKKDNISMSFKRDMCEKNRKRF